MPEGLLPHQEDMYRELRQERINHNAAVEAGRARTAEEMGQFMAQIVNELKPERVSHPQLKLEMPERGNLLHFNRCDRLKKNNPHHVATDCKRERE